MLWQEGVDVFFSRVWSIPYIFCIHSCHDVFVSSSRRCLSLRLGYDFFLMYHVIQQVC